MKDDYVYPRGNAPGMELRDLFAAFALAGFSEAYISGPGEAKVYARLAYELADAAMKKRIETND